MAQTTTTTKPAAAKQAAKSRAKPAAAKKQAAKPAAPVNGIKFAIRDGYRPAAGRALAAYTQAWLTVSGLVQGGTIPRAELTKIAGQTAVSYHTTRTGALQDDKGAVSLTESGRAFFAARGADQAMADKFAAVLKGGALDETIGVKVAAAVIPMPQVAK